ncbi:MAG TPA: hypothetical protein VIL41_04355 [Coriobacteriia bacterium]
MTGKRRWGFSEPEWADARRALEELLAEAGRSRSTVTYGEVARRALGGRVSARSSALMDLLVEVDSEADARLGCMVASLVVRGDTGMPGEGYFHFATEELGRPIGDQEGFWRTEVERVWDAYAAEASQHAPEVNGQAVRR